ncbi:MAG: glycosyltransferase [Paludibacteraceae bacterium]|nr:glycosyltransferase [Paludibacteraceae bacterium]
MKVVLINTLTPGGAYVACQRLYDALRKQGVDVSFVAVKAKRRHFLWERFCIWAANGFSRKNLFAVSVANTGTDISQLPEVREADIIHLHWINHGGLSLRNIQQLQALGKLVVWTMHDMWPFTGICHHAYDCTAYETQCTQCPQNAGVLAKNTFIAKCVMWKRLHFVGCSEWIASLARRSHLTKNSKICSIPNPIDTTLYYPVSKQEARKRLGLEPYGKYVLFGAMNTTSEMKGFQNLREADKLIASDEVQYLVFGRNAGYVVSLLSHKGKSLGYVNDEHLKTLIYSAADVFVTPSLAENLPNMIMEAMACGTPCVGFQIGGIPEMIDHNVNGYVARHKDAADFAEGINRVLASRDEWGIAARKKVMNTYSEEKVANQYIELYKSLLTAE